MKRFLFLLATLYCTNIYADDTSDYPAIPELRNIVYDYELTEENSHISCSGTLSFDIYYPKDTKRIIFEKSRGYLKPGERIRLGSKTEIQFTRDQIPTRFKTESGQWGFYFRVIAVVESDEFIFSPYNYSNDFMRPEDSERVLAHTSIKAPEDVSDVNLHVDGRTLHIDTQREVDLSVYTMTGSRIYSGSTSVPIAIPLDNIPPQILIVRYNIYGTVKTQKIILK